MKHLLSVVDVVLVVDVAKGDILVHRYSLPWIFWCIGTLYYGTPTIRCRCCAGGGCC